MGDVAALVRSERDILPLPFNDFVNYFNYNGGLYPLGMQQTLVGEKQEWGAGLEGVVQGASRANGIVFACILARMLLFSEARFKYRRLSDGGAGRLFGDPRLRILERPDVNRTTRDLLASALVDIDLAGNFYAARRPGNRLVRMRPDWVTILSGSPNDPDMSGWDLDARVVGYFYHEGGRQSGKDPVPLLPESVAHFAPIPDPLARWRGMSWLQTIAREVKADSAATAHKLRFFEAGGTPNIIITLKPEIEGENFDRWVEKYDRMFGQGLKTAYKTMYLGAGATHDVVGRDFQQMDFKVTQGAGETRIAAAAGVPPVIVGLSEGLAAATYSNYGQARRRFADLTMRPLWGNFAASMESIVPPPDAGAELWYDETAIPALREDAKDRAEIQGRQAATIRTLVDAGYDPATVIPAVLSENWTDLKHTGLYSVQLQPPSTTPIASPTTQAGRALAELVAPFLNGKEA
jgi:phage portal protein BeeE